MITQILAYAAYGAASLVLFMMGLGAIILGLSPKPPMDPMENCPGCPTCRPQKAMRERFGDADGQSDHSKYLEARRMIERAREAKWN